ncbi:hypothetical protein L3V82_09765 [Thiotrichales bacterium 19S3-7]|nr:hypothetical protein [Thiotrichales bacterium 19S3-7]MCF6802445.1 hypothetical protein [Thiotrichales bacterium 19S3-11]
MNRKIKSQLYVWLFAFLLVLVIGFGNAYAKAPLYIKLTYNDLLASKLWAYSQYNNDKIVTMIKSDIGVYAEIFTPKLYQQYPDNPQELEKHFRTILNAFIAHLNNYYQSNYYLQKTITLGKFNTQSMSFDVDIPQRFYITYNGDLPFSINGYNFTPSYYIDLKGDYKAVFTYTKSKGKAIENNPNQKACLRVFLESQSLVQVDTAHKYANDNYTAQSLSFSLYPNKSCD